jgi:hypothetical protein
MYQLLRNRTVRAISVDTVPPLLLAFVIAELFYKWHSFTLECIGFLATWFVFDWVWSNVCSSKASERS